MSGDIKPAGYVHSLVHAGPCVVCGDTAAWSIQTVKQSHIFGEPIGDAVLVCEGHYSKE